MLGIAQTKNSSGMASRNHAGCYAALNQRRQSEKTQGIGDLGTRTPDALGKFLLSAPEVLEQLPVGRSFLQWVELSTVQVLQKRIAKEICIFDVPNDCRNRRQTCVLRRPQTTLTHDELEARTIARLLPDDDRLKDTDLTNAVHKLGQEIFVEDSTWLTRIRIDEVDIDLTELGIRNGLNAVHLTVVIAVDDLVCVSIDRILSLGR